MPSIRLEVVLCSLNACLVCSLQQDLGIVDELALQVMRGLGRLSGRDRSTTTALLQQGAPSTCVERLTKQATTEMPPNLAAACTAAAEGGRESRLVKGSAPGACLCRAASTVAYCTINTALVAPRTSLVRGVACCLSQAAEGPTCVK